MYQVTVIDLSTGKTIVSSTYESVETVADTAEIRVFDSQGKKTLVPTGVTRLQVQAYTGTDAYDNFTPFVDETEPSQDTVVGGK